MRAWNGVRIHTRPRSVPRSLFEDNLRLTYLQSRPCVSQAHKSGFEGSLTDATGQWQASIDRTEELNGTCRSLCESRRGPAKDQLPESSPESNPQLSARTPAPFRGSRVAIFFSQCYNQDRLSRRAMVLLDFLQNYDAQVRANPIVALYLKASTSIKLQPRAEH